MADPRLPIGLLIQVLILLPVKSLLKFKCVSKSWRDLITSPLFIHMQLKSDRKRSVLLLKNIPFTFSTSPSEGVPEFSFHDPNHPESLVSPNLSFPLLNDDLNDLLYNQSIVPIQGPCNGLICVSLRNVVLFCNPALRELKFLPPLIFANNFTGQPLGYGFGFDQISGVYKVVHIWEHRLLGSFVPSFQIDLNEIRVGLYDSASKSWKQIDAKVPYISHPPSVGVFINGMIHWNADTAVGKHPCILCFDVTSETFRQIEFNDSFFFPANDRNRCLMELDGCMAMVLWDSTSIPYEDPMNDVEIWVMKEYGVVESWTKHFAIYACGISSPVCFVKNELLLLQIFDGQVEAYTIPGKKCKNFPFRGLFNSGVVYEESLISLKDI
ncbi:F-box/kelch-repeat protein At3g23880-like [Henckelia pumila]|uniref:F-box/kelch-repeat protein At3g23880-like n=1 Tax=Henckelia pumila TaxID=405737 RepID=UPI003C6E6D7C